ncbi:hypothetical protein C2U62_14075 [Klebsiella michiganensis]|nr:hypothetical protein [Klebsiella michiganensis]
MSGTRSPGKAFTPQPGEYAVTWHCYGFFPACAALSRATGPQIAGNRSPDRCAASPPGRVLTLVDIVEQMLNQ